MNPLSKINPTALTVTELTRQIKGLLESNFPVVRLRGEVSNLRQQQSGHVYFSLKDKGAAISCVCFRGDASRLEIQLCNGLEIIGTGKVAVYEPRGNYQVIFRTIEEDGVGRLQQAFLRLKEKLSAEGLFDSDRKKALPKLPKRIAFVTSETGAALRDFISIIRRRNWAGELIVIPARVQGDGAAREIVRGIEIANREDLCDLLVIGRGGGSLEDLWPFNEEIVARAVASSRIPLISAVGHEIDFTLSDFAADFRAETPSAAAEWITSAWQAYFERYTVLHDRLQSSASRKFERMGHRLSIATVHLQHQHPRNRLDQSYLRIDDLQSRLGQVLQTTFRDGAQRLQLLHNRFNSLKPESHIRHYREKLRQISLRLVNNSHQSTLKRGYAIIRDGDDSLISDCKNVPSDSAFIIEMRDGRVPATRKADN